MTTNLKLLRRTSACLLLVCCFVLYIFSDVFSGEQEHGLYMEFKGRRALKLHCNTCAYVSSSGQLTGKKSGKEINSKDCIIRNNNAPYYGFEADVGSRTTLRVVAHSAMVEFKNYLRKDPGGRSERSNTIFVVWGPDRNIAEGKETYKHMEYLQYYYWRIKLYYMTDERVADDAYFNETGLQRIESKTWLSTGWFTFLLAKKICNSIYVYGMIDETHCDDVLKGQYDDVPYHYYDPKGPKECSLYNSSEHSTEDSHKFITEKRIFKKWSRERENIFFHTPEWY